MKLALKGRYAIKHLREGHLVGEYQIPNGIVDVGLNHLLEGHFRAGPQSAAWYLGLIDNGSYTGLADADTMTSHAGWIEATIYTGNRKLWDVGVASGRAISNGVPAEFAINAGGVIRGIFVNTDETGTSGVLWATALFTSAITVENGDTLKVTYTVSG